jgi:hypothetical protein
VKYRAVANGNLVDDVPESLVTAGIYELVDEPTDPKPEVKPEPEPEAEPEGGDESTSIAPIGTEDMPAESNRSTRKKAR